MDNKSPLHIYVESKPGQIFHKDIGWLELKKAESFNIFIKEFKDEKDALTKKSNQDLKNLHDDYSNKIKDIEKSSNKVQILSIKIARITRQAK